MKKVIHCLFVITNLESLTTKQKTKEANIQILTFNFFIDTFLKFQVL